MDCKPLKSGAWATFVAVALGVLSATSRGDTVLTVGEYLNQVRQGNQGVRASEKATGGAEARKNEADLLYAPQAFAEAQFLDDRKQPLMPSQGNETIGNVYRLGVQQQTGFGLKTRLFTEVDYLNLKGATPLAVPQNRFYEGHQTLELSQSLLRNGFGSETRATEALVRAGAEAKSQSETFKRKVTLAQAEVAYWKLVAAREAVQVKIDSLERAKKVQAWNRRRENLDLGRKTDLLQSSSAVKLVELDLQASRDEARAAAWAFNSARGLESENVSESLVSLADVPVAHLAKPTRNGPREDLKAAEQAKIAATAQSDLAVERNRPNLEISAAVTLNGRDQGVASAWNESVTTKRATLGAGIKFSVPLAFGTVDAVAGGYRQEAMAAELEYDRRKYEQDREWGDLDRKFDEATRRLSLANDIEAAQKEKWLNEQHLHDFGKTTTFQVLTFEQDYAVAQLNRIRFHSEALQLLAQMNLFGGAQ